jgi:hypothetical protein
MPSKRVKKALKATLNAPQDDESIYPPSPLLLPLDCLPLNPPAEPEPEPLIEPIIKLANEPTIDAKEKAAVLKWTAEMIEALVECIYRVWKDGRAADNGFKKEAWMEASNAVQRVYQGPLTIEWEKCKNKWTDLKEKWKHWLILSEMSGFGWDEEKERYEAVSIYSSDITSSIDPRLLSSIPSASASTSASPVPSLYNKSKRRAKVEISDDEDGGRAIPTRKKVDLGYAITSLSVEMAKSRKLREDHKSDQEKAVQLLESEYGDRLDTMVFIKACTFFEDEHKARSFLAISNIERRDRWLEVNLQTELLPSL